MTAPKKHWVTAAAWRPSQAFLLTSAALVLGYAVVDLATLPDGRKLTDWLAGVKNGRAGRPTTRITFRDVLAAKVALSVLGEPLTTRGVAKILGTSRPPAHVNAGKVRRWPTGAGTKKGKRQRWAAERAVQRCWDYLVDELDSYPGPRSENKRRYTFAEALVTYVRAEEAIADDIRALEQAPAWFDAAMTDHEVVLAWRDQIDTLRFEVVNSLVEASLALIPRRILGTLNESLAIDGTYVASYARGTAQHFSMDGVLDKSQEAAVRVTAEYGLKPAPGLTDAAADLDVLVQHKEMEAAGTLPPKRKTGYKKDFVNPLNYTQLLSIDLEAHWYVRNKEGKPETKGFGVEAHAGISIGRSQPGRVTAPALIICITADTPSRRLDTNAERLLRHARRWADSQGIPMWKFVGDMAYPGLSPRFRREMRLLGWSPIWRLPIDVAQAAYEATVEQGLVHGADAWYCQEMPESLLHVHIDYAEEHIDAETRDERVAERLAYAAKPTHGPIPMKSPGEPRNLRISCPARSVGGAAPGVSCARHLQTWGMSDIVVIDVNATDIPKAEWPAACRQQTVSMNWEIDAVHGTQAHPIGTPEWLRDHGLLRSINEGKFGAMKSSAYVGLKKYDWSRDRGVAAHSLNIGAAAAGANITAIQSFIEQSVPEAGGRVREYPTPDVSLPANHTPPTSDAAGAWIKTPSGKRWVPLNSGTGPAAA